GPNLRELGVLAWEAARKVGARVLLLGDKGYPPQLRRIARPPRLLYVRGNLAPESRRVAVVGSRAADEVGLDLAEGFGELFARAGDPGIRDSWQPRQPAGRGAERPSARPAGKACDRSRRRPARARMAHPGNSAQR